ncbi:hypothetical protein [Nocardioides daeguensis]|uniref:DUF3040 domain-containing protein n=1 Tax=Nocardioides daeguensis TaxID=908359 RepID=A0ABP6UT76_9ACTN|nr:hypothetical protein [Nocardioides daeguensis]MBV6725737.1 hypothetical protein [Nocardioides daeguensis]MCR1772748.1 hypothetical protein [Nocardioides daeguensis]
MQRDDPDNDDAAWQAIIDNYGERVEIDPPDDPDDDPGPAPEGGDELYDDRYDDAYDEIDLVDEDRFVPDAAPPVPVPPADRMLAWLGVFGSPTVLLVFLVLGLGMPSWLGWLLVAGFVGGFCYLVIRTPGSPRDPWDDGARV